jgi:FkbM family methyltransferase
MPLLHRFPFWYSWNGFRGSQYVWALFGSVKKIPDSQKIQLPSSFPLIVNEKDWISKTIYQGTYERSLLHFLDSLFLSNLVVDVGANVGVTLWHSLRNANVDTRFMAFEPSKQCLPGLLIATSQIDNSGHVLGYAIGDSDGIQTMHGIENEVHSGGASLISHSGQRGHSEDVDVRRLDSIVAEYSASLPVSLLKIDTEGYESHVIDGASQLLESGLVEIIVMEVSPNFGEVSYLREVHQLLGDSYHWFTLDESGTFKRKPCLRTISLERSLSRTQQWNLVLVRDDVLESYIARKHRVFLRSGSSF